MVTLGIITSAAVLSVLSAGNGGGDTSPRLVTAGHCLAVSKKVLAQRAVPIEGKVVAPRKVRDVPPAYPSREGPSVGKGLWLGEALIDGSGKVREVWALQEFEFDPAWPEFNDAIPIAIRQWEYTPAVVKGKAVPVCMTISLEIHWK